MHRSTAPAGRAAGTTSVVAVLALLAATLLTSAAFMATAPTASAAPSTPGAVIALRPLSTSSDLRIVDDLGRDVVLRGANVNALGEYWQGDPGTPPTIPLTDADWASMAARGFSVVRLLVTWSRIEPSPGVIDTAYLDLVDSYVGAAADHGIYTVIDMHQDAWGAAIATTNPATCPPGTGPGKGWDGAPAWATITDGASTCTTGGRETAPAVIAAFNHFYDNTNGVRDHFFGAWAAVATRFAGRSEVAGYDLLNEPLVSRPAAELQPLYDDFVGTGVTAIRDAEAAAGATFGHLIFVEPTIPAADLSWGLVIPNPAGAGVDATGIVAAPHNYAESIGDYATIEAMFELYQSTATSLGVPTWIGEYGWWDTDDATLAKVRRYAAEEDRRILGGTWWQWRQSCGDPHHVQWQGGTVVVPAGVSTQLNLLDCPTNTDLGPNDAFLDVLGRGYPRAAPGRVTALDSDPATGRLDAVASVDVAGGQVVVWTPTTDDTSQPVTVENLRDVTVYDVDGGRIVVATVTSAGCYAVHVASTATSCAVASTSLPATPIAATVTPAFTG